MDKPYLSVNLKKVAFLDVRYDKNFVFNSNDSSLSWSVLSGTPRSLIMSCFGLLKINRNISPNTFCSSAFMVFEFSISCMMHI